MSCNVTPVFQSVQTTRFIRTSAREINHPERSATGLDSVRSGSTSRGVLRANLLPGKQQVDALARLPVRPVKEQSTPIKFDVDEPGRLRASLDRDRSRTRRTRMSTSRVLRTAPSSLATPSWRPRSSDDDVGHAGGSSAAVARCNRSRTFSTARIHPVQRGSGRNGGGHGNLAALRSRQRTPSRPPRRRRRVRPSPPALRSTCSSAASTCSTQFGRLL